MPEPTIDPITGKPTTPAPDPNAPPAESQVSKADYEALRARLDVFEQNAANFNRQPAPPPAPSGPSYEEQLSNFDKAIDSLDAQIDAATEDGKPISKLLRERDKINATRTRLEVTHEMEPKFAAGMQTIDYLSGEVTRGKMEHYDLVKKDMDTHLSQLPANERMNPQVRQKVYEIAVGMNIGKILEKQKEEVLRSAAADPTTTPGGANSRVKPGEYSAGVPNPRKVLGDEVMSALRAKGVTVDQEYQRRGYAGWEDYYEKVGKKYFGDIEGEA